MSLIYKIVLFTLSFSKEACLPPDHRIWWTNVDISTFEARLLLSSRCWVKSFETVQFSSVQSLSRVWLFVTPWTAAHQASLSFQLLELTQTHVHRVNVPSNHLITCRLLSSCLQSFPASGSFPMGQFFASGGQSIGVSASASVLPMNIQD